MPRQGKTLSRKEVVAASITEQMVQDLLGASTQEAELIRPYALDTSKLADADPPQTCMFCGERARWVRTMDCSVSICCDKRPCMERTFTANS